MQIHGLAHVHGAQPLNGPHRTQPSQAAPASDSWSGMDEVEISREAELISQVREMPDIRADRVAEIRAEIAAGAYETDEKLDVALGRLLDEISG